MTNFISFISPFSLFFPLARTIIFIIFFILLLNAVVVVIKKRLLARAKNKHQISNIQLFTKILRYAIIFLVLAMGFVFHSGSWAGFGVAAGLMSAAIGFALQKPISGIAAWLVIIVQRPFKIGDRIVFGTVKGDVLDIGLTHTIMKELGIDPDGEEVSGKTTFIPNAFLFDHGVVNFTRDNDFILGKVVVSVTYESDMQKAQEIVLDSAVQFTKEFFSEVQKKPYLRVAFAQSSLDVAVKFYAPHEKIQEIKSSITGEIYENIKKQKGVEIAYPHMELIVPK